MESNDNLFNPVITTAETIPIFLNYNKTLSLLLIFILITHAKIEVISINIFHIKEKPTCTI